MRETLIHKVEITKQGQRKFFQIILPKDTLKICSVGYSVKALSSIPIGYRPGKGNTSLWPSLTIADLFLSSNKKEGQFFREILLYDDAHLGYLDSTNVKWKVQPATHGINHSGLHVMVDGKTSQVYGSLKDIAGETYLEDFRYRVTIYIEIEKP